MSREMKQSGVPWIGEIPKNWEIRKVKDVFVRKNEKAHQDNPVILSLARAGVKVRDVSTNEGQMAESYYDYNPVEPFDLLVNPMDLYSGANCSMSLVSGVISPAYVNLRAKGGACSRFYDYYFKTQYWSMAFFAHGKGISFDNRWTLGVDTLFRYNVPFPSVLEQQKIASFLDRKCAEIDEMIALQEKIVEELKAYKQSVITEAVTKGLNPDVTMKDSGIEWVGDIPEHWTLKKLKYSCKIYGRIGFRGYTADDLVDEKEGAITLSPTNMNGIDLDFSKCSYLSWDKYYESPEIMVNTGDVLLVKTASVGKCSYVDSLPMETTVNPQILVLKEHKDCPKYIAYLFQTPIGQHYIETTKGGSTIYTISQERIGNYEFEFPPLNEQKIIVDYLDTKCTEINNLISTKLSKIDSLEEYKKSIIYEYVTGKKEVI